jgi:hypothetical protein
MPAPLAKAQVKSLPFSDNMVNRYRYAKYTNVQFADKKINRAAAHIHV